MVAGNEAGFRVLFECATIGILVINESGEIELLNSCAENLFGYTQEELLGKPVEILIPKNLRSKHTQHREGYFSHPKTRSMGSGMELYACKKEGVVFPVEISLGHYVLDGDSMAVAFVTDITERKSAQQKLLEQHERYRLLFQSIWEPFIVQEIIRDEEDKIIDLRYLEVNSRAEEMLGKKSHELVGHLRSEVQGPFDEQSREVIDRVISKNEQITSERYIPSIDRWFQINSYSPLPNQIATLSLDITERKKAQDELQKLNEELETRVENKTRELQESVQREKEMNELKSRFVSMASHEFRTPLSVVLSSASLIGQYVGEGNERVSKHLSKIKSAVGNLTNILNDFLSLDKLEQGKVEIEWEAFDMDEFAKEMIEETLSIRKRGQQINANHSGNKWIKSDYKTLRYVAVNLISNAIKYSEENGLINLTSKVDGNLLTISIQDQGIGIPEEEQKYLFEKFFRAKNTGAIQGTGLGLTIVKRYVELLGGSITFVSEVNKGSTFTISLPQSS